MNEGKVKRGGVGNNGNNGNNGKNGKNGKNGNRSWKVNRRLLARIERSGSFHWQ